MIDKKSSKVCLVSVLPPLFSGVSLYTQGLLSGFAKRKVPCELVVLANKSAQELTPQVDGLRIIKAWSRDARYLIQVLSAIVKEKPVVVHFQHEFFLFGGMFTAATFPLLLLTLRLMGIKTVVTMHGVISKSAANSEFAEGFFVPKSYLLLRVGLGSLTTIICRLSNTMIVHSSAAKAALIQDYWISPKKIKVVQHGIGHWESNPQKKASEKEVLFFGNITPTKGIEDLIAAFEQVSVPDAKLIIAGGPHPRGKMYFQKISELVRASPKSNRIVITGFVPDKEIHDLFDRCTIAVFPYTFSVSCSGGLSFALQHRKPPVVSSLPSFTETIVDGVNGLVVPPNDKTALAWAMERLLIDDRLREKLSRGIAEDCAHLKWSEIASETVKCYQQVQC
jgi:glycosyltransferase involved in cell wall biosynthesis